MKNYLTCKVGIINNLIILVISGFMAFLGVLSMMNQEQATRLKQHLFTFFISRYFFLVAIGLVPVAALVLLNLLFQLVEHRKINGQLIIALFIRAFLLMALAVLLGHGFLCANL